MSKYARPLTRTAAAVVLTFAANSAFAFDYQGCIASGGTPEFINDVWVCTGGGATQVPEPTTLGLMGIGILGAVGLSRRRKK